jgi:hypothetical protein
MSLVAHIIFWLTVVTIAVRLAQLAWGVYPRTREATDRWEDVVGLTINSVWAFYLYYIIWAHPTP